MGHFITTMSIGRSSSESSTPRTDTSRNAVFRPQTSVLVRARVLNVEKLEELGLDMALTTKEFLNSNSELIMPRRNTIARHLLARRVNSPHRTAPNDAPNNNNRPTNIPVLQPVPSSSKTLSKKDKTSKIRRSKSLRQNGTYDNKEYRSLTSFMTAGVDLGVPKPCTSCSRSDLPERFHSHPPSAHHKKSLLPVPKPVPVSSAAEAKEPSPEKGSSSALQRANSFRKPATRSPYRVRSSNSSPASSAPSSRKLYSTHTIPEEREDAVDPLIVALCPAEAVELGESENTSSVSSGEGSKEARTTTEKNRRFLVCYICGRLFGTTSLKIHEPQCLEKWLRENEALPEHLKRPIPKKPEDGEDYNDSAYAVFESTLLPCPNCGRTFLPDRLPVHQRACKGPPGSTPKTVKSPPNESSHEDANTTKKRQRVLVLCYICSREFGNASLRIHEPQCLKKWHNENQKLPSNLRRPEPSKPVPVVNEDGKVDREATWEVLWKSHLDQLTPCPNCDRKFRPDRLEVHLRSCRDK